MEWSVIGGGDVAGARGAAERMVQCCRAVGHRSLVMVRGEVDRERRLKEVEAGIVVERVAGGWILESGRERWDQVPRFDLHLALADLARARFEAPDSLPALRDLGPVRARGARGVGEPPPKPRPGELLRNATAEGLFGRRVGRETTG